MAVTLNFLSRTSGRDGQTVELTFENGEKVQIRAGDLIELKGIDLSLVELSPDGRNLVVRFPNNDTLVFDNFLGLQSAENPPQIVDPDKKLRLPPPDITDSESLTAPLEGPEQPQFDNEKKEAPAQENNQGTSSFTTQTQTDQDPITQSLGTGEETTFSSTAESDLDGASPPPPPTSLTTEEEPLLLTATASDNIKPFVDLNGADAGIDTTASFVEADGLTGGPVLMSPAGIAGDDDGLVVEMTVVITNPFNGADEILAVDLTGLPLTASFDPLTKTLTIVDDGSGTATNADYAAALQNVVYNNTSDNPTGPARTIGVKVFDDQGAGSDVAFATIDVTGVNDAPVLATPGPQSGLEDTLFDINGLGVTDPDATEVEVSLSVSNGSLTLPITAGLEFVAGANGSSTVTFRGSVGEVNAALDNLRYLGAQDFNGSDQLSITVNDLDTGAPLSDSGTVDITVTPVNDAPEITVPGAQTVDEDASLAVSGISISDVDVNEGTGEISTTLFVEHGTLTLGTTTGLSFTAGANGTTSLTVQGSLSDVNAALASLSYQPDADYFGDDKLTIQTSDLGNTGSSVQTDMETVAITVNAINDAPEVSVPGAQTVDEDTSLAISGISVADVDATGGTGEVEVTLSADHGILTLRLTAGLEFVSGGNGTNTMTIRGSVSEMNAALPSLLYQGDADFNGNDQITVTVNDLGNTGSPGALSDTGIIDITVNPVNDPPVLTVPGAQTVDEDASIAISGISVSDVDVDEGTGEVSATLSVTSGALTLGDTTGLTFNSGANGDSTFTIQGTLADVNNALATLSYQGDADFNGADQLSITVNDLGNTGSPGPLTDTETVDITVNPVNDAPVLTVPGAQTVDEDTPISISGISVSDVDVNERTGEVSVSLSVTSGDLTLGTTTGLVFTGANGTSSFTIQGTLADVNNALATLSYQGDADFNGADQLSITVNDLGNTGSPGALTDTETVDITVNPVNDAPVLTVPGAQTVDEDASIAISGISISDVDVDEGTGEVSATLSVTSGALTLGDTTGLTFNSGANGDSTFTIQGTLADVNNALATLSYQGDADFNGADQLSITVNDLGNMGSPGPLTDTETVDITVNPVNDAPVLTVPGAQTVDEDASIAISGISVSDVDVDEGTGEVSVSLSVTSGDLTLGTTTGLAFTGTNGTSSFTIQGTLADVNNALETLSYQGDADFNGADQLSITVNDLGNTGSPGALTDTETVDITVNPVNDAPVLTVPGAQTVDEDASIAISGISVSDVDVDEGTGEVSVSLSVTSGDLTLGTTTGLVFTGTNGTSSFTIQGTLADVNNALATLSYQGDADFNGADQLSITVNDLGNTGSPGALTDTETIDITVNPVNDAPVLTVPGAQTVDEDTSIAISGISVSDVDVDEGTGEVSVSLSVTSGDLTLGTTTGLTFTGTNGTSSFTVQGSLTDVNNALATLSYQGDADFNGADQLSITVNDLGNTGSPGALTDTETVDITVNPVNDAPVLTVPGAQTVDEDASISISGISVSDVDVDEGTGEVSVSLSVTSGDLTLGTTTGLAFTGTNGTSSFTIQGTLTDVNNALATLSYQGDADFNGADQLSITVNDLGNTGSPGALTDTETVDITVNPVNDAPVLTVPGAQTVDEDTSIAISGISVSDVDVDEGTGEVSVSLSVTSGDLTLGTTTGLTFNAGTNGTSGFTVQGSLADVNNALATLSYQGDADFNGADQLSITVNDLGNTGSPGALTDTETVDITVNPVNDAPVLTVPGAQTVDEDASISISGISVSDVDVDEGTGEVSATLSVTSGALTLGDTTGLTFNAGANGDSTFTIQGTLADVNNALATLSYQGDADFNGADQLSITVNDLGNTGSPGALTDTETVDITVSPVNDAPVLTVPGAQTVDEDTSIAISGISVSDVDVDEGTGEVSVSLSVRSGDLTLGTTTGLTFTGTNGTSSFTIQGTLADVNNALATLSYQGDADFNGADQLSITVNDLGNTGSPGALTDTETVDITVNPVNDAPVLTVPGAQTVDEDASIAISGISVSDVDVDEGTGEVSATLSVTSGALTLGDTTGLTFNVGTNGTSGFTVQGTLADVNNALATLSYQGDADFNGADQLSITVNDLGNTGSPGALTDTETVDITVNPVNDAPVLTVPGAQTVEEDTSISISGISVSDVDVDEGTGEVSATLSVTSGALTLGTTTGLTFNAGANGTSTFTIQGTLADVNNALATLSYQGDADFNGADQLSITVNDLGNTGSPGALTDTETVDITVNPVNDAPVLTVPGAQTVDEDASIAISGISVSDVDVDEGTGEVSATLSVTSGALTLGDTTGLTFNVGTNGTSGFTVQGTLADVNNALATLSYQGDADFNGADQITVTVNDLGNTGSPGALTDTETIDITVNPVNDPPVLTVPGAQTVDEDTSISISGISVSDVDVDEGTGEVSATLSVTSGALTLGDTTGLTFNAGANGDSTFTIQGTLADVNNALATLSYQGDADFNGADQLSITVNDLGNTGSPGALTDTETVDITVNPVNGAPVLTVPGAQTVDEDTSISISGISVSDVDVNEGTGEVSATLSVTSGALTLGDTTGLTFTGTNGTSSFTIQGTLADVNNALATLSYQGDADFNGADQLSITVNDLGNTGSPGALTDTETIDITVNPVNDAPVVAVPPSLTFAEDTPSSIFGVNVSDVDVNEGTGEMEVTLSVSNGNLMLGTTTGLTFVSGANGTATMTVRGQLSDINAALDTLGYQGNLNFNGSDQLVVTADDLGNFGAGGALTDTQTVDLTITPVNDAPVLALPGAQTVDEDTSIAITGISISDVDVDEGTGLVEVSLAVDNGTLTLGDTTGLTFTSGANGSAFFNVSGTVADVNAALTTLSYQGVLDFNGSDSLTVAVSDLGNTGAGGDLVDTGTIDITVNPIDDEPLLTVPGAQTVAEDSSVTIMGMSISDPDVLEGDGNVEVTLSVTEGTLAFGDTTGLTFVSGTNGEANITVRGHVNDMNMALNTLTYAGAANYNGADSLTVTVSDLGNTGAGGPLTDTDVIAIDVTPVNDAPVLTVPAAQTLLIDGSVALSGFSIADIDVNEGTGEVEASLMVNSGTLTLGSLTGVTVTNGANGTSFMTIRGQMSDVTSSLNSLTYSGDSGFAGSDQLTVTVSDLGNFGAGGDLTDMGTVALTVQAPPSVDLDGDDSTAAGTSYAATYTENDLEIPISDVDTVISDVDSTQIQSATITLTNPEVDDSLFLDFTQLPLPGGISSSITDTQIILSGAATLADYQTAIETVRYEDVSENPVEGDRIISVTVTDTDGLTSDPALSTITVVSVPDGPLLDLDADNSTDTGADASFDFTVGGGAIQVADIDTSIADPDSTQISSATITLSNPFDGDALSIDGTLPAGITLALSDADQIILTGTGAFADYETAIEQIRFDNANDVVSDVTRIIDVTVEDDGGTQSNLAQSSITIIGGFAPPTLDLDGDDSVASGTGFATTFDLGGAAVPIADADTLITDADSTQIFSATISIANPQVDDSLLIDFTQLPLPGGITSSITNNQIILNGAATLADYQTAIEAIRFENLSDTPSTVERIIEVTVEDDIGLFSNVAATTVAINAPNPAPALDLDADDSTDTGADALVSFTPGGGAVRIADIDTSVTDANSAQMQSATIALGNAQADDALSILGTLPGGISVASQTANQIVLTGFADLADYETAIEKITFNNTGASPSTVDRLIDVTVVDDGGAASNVAQSTITFASGNVVPALDLDADDSTDTGTDFSATFVPLSGGVALADVDVAISDADSTAITSATFTLINPEANDSLSVGGTLPAGIEVFVTDANQIVLGGAATLAEYETALQQIIFDNDLDVPVTGDRIVQISVQDDSGAASNLADATITVTDPNAAPALDLDSDNSTFEGSDAAFTFLAGNGPVQVADTDTLITDADDVNMQSATIELTNLQTGDALSISGTLPSGVTASTVSSSLIVLTGVAGLSDYQTAIEQIRFDNTEASPDTTDRVIEVSVQDEKGGRSNLANSFISISTATPDPVVDLDADDSTDTGLDSTVVYAGFGQPVAIADIDTSITDADSVQMRSATITITNPEFGDTLGIGGSLPSGISVFSFTGTEIVLRGFASRADYEAAIELVTFDNTQERPSDFDRLIAVTVEDDTGLQSGVATATVLMGTASGNPVLDLDANDSTDTGLDSSVNFTPGGGAIAISDIDPSITDVNSTDMREITFTLSNPQAGDALSVGALPAGITVFSATSTEIVLRGFAPSADYETAINAISYNNTNGSPSTVDRVIDVIVVDQDGLASLPAQATITYGVAAVAPVLDLDADDSTDTGSDFATTFIPGGGAVAVADTDTLITDADSASLRSATITITNPVEGDTLVVGSLPEDISVFSDTGTEIVIRGIASLADYEAALEAIGFDHTGASPGTTDRIIDVVVEDDASLLSNVAQTTVAIGAANAAPVLDLDADDSTAAGNDAAFTFTEGGGAVQVADFDTLITDADSTQMQSATVTLTNVQSGDVIGVGSSLPAGIAVASQTATEIIFTGLASAADYEAALETVLFNNTSVNASVTDRLIDVSVTDDAGVISNTATSTISVISDNTPPSIDLDADDSTATGTASSVTFTEGGGAVQLADVDSQVMDIDNTQLRELTITLTNPDVADELSISGTPASGITVFENTVNRIILRGFADLADYEQAIEAITFNNTSNAPAQADRIVEFVGVDASGAQSNIAQATVSITIINSTPSLDLDANDSTDTGFDARFTYTENDAPVRIADTDTLISDADNANMQSATITLTNPESGDALSNVTLPSGITVASAAANEIVLTGIASRGSYQSAIEAIRFETVGDTPVGGDRLITVVSVDEDGAGTNTATSTITVQPVNDAPLVDLNTADGSGQNNVIVLPAFTEGDGFIQVATLNVGTSDVDDVNLETATITLTNAFAGDEIRIVDGAGTALSAGQTVVGNITVASISGNQIVLTGSDSKTNYDEALERVQYRNTSEDPDTTTRLFDFVVNDGELDSNTATASIDVIAVNDAPVLDLDANNSTDTGSDASFTFTEGSAPIAIADADTVISDVDNANMQSATITISNAGGADVLSVAGALPSGITISSQTASQIVLAGSSSIANYQTAIEQVRYENTSQNPGTFTRVINVTVNDGTDNSNTAVSSISVVRTNDAPVLDLDADNSTDAGFDSFRTYTENSGNARIPDADVVITDVDSSSLQSATITFSNPQSGDQFFMNSGAIPAGISIASSSATQVVLTGTASAADYQTALETARFRNDSDNLNNTNRLFTFVVQDDAGAFSNTATGTIDPVPINDAPTLDLDANNSTALGTSFFTNFDLNGRAAVSISDVDTNVVDVDHANMSSATITLTNPLAGDTLLVGGTLPSGITVTSNTGTQIVLSGSSSQVNYETAIETIRFDTTSSNFTDRVIDVVVRDNGGAVSNTASATINIVDTSPPPPPPASLNLDLDGDDSSGASFDDWSGSVFEQSSSRIGFAANGSGVGQDVEITGNTAVTSATFSVDNFETGDRFQINGTLPPGISVSSSGSGFLTLTGTGSFADWETAIEAVAFNPNSDNPNPDHPVSQPQDRFISVSISGSSAGDTETATMTVNEFNDGPSLSFTSSNSVFKDPSGGTAVQIMNNIDILDPDSLPDRVRIDTSFSDPDNFFQLAGALPPGISVTALASQSIVLDGTGSLQDWETALSLIEFGHRGTGASPSSVGMTVLVADSEGTENATQSAFVNLRTPGSVTSLTSQAPRSHNEGSNGQITFTVSRVDGAGEGNSIQFEEFVSISAGPNNEAVFGVDISQPPSSIRFAPGQTSVSFTVDILKPDNSISDGDVRIQLVHSPNNPESSRDPAAIGAGGTILDDDVWLTLEPSFSSDLDVSEPDQQTVSLGETYASMLSSTVPLVKQHMRVVGVRDGFNEALLIGGIAIVLVAGTKQTVAVDGIEYAVSVSEDAETGHTAILIESQSGPVDEAAWKAMLGTIEYTADDLATLGERKIGFKAETEDGLKIDPMLASVTVVHPDFDSTNLIADQAADLVATSEQTGEEPSFLSGKFDTLKGLFGKIRDLSPDTFDVKHGGTGDDIITGGAGNQIILGFAGNDTLDGGEGDDILLGGAGDDTLIATDGVDMLFGGAGDDVFAFADNDGDGVIDLNDSSGESGDFDALFGGQGHDTLRIESDDVDVDLVAMVGPLANGIERVDVSGKGENLVTVDMDTVLEIIDPGSAVIDDSGAVLANAFVIDGDAADHVNTNGTFMRDAAGTTASLNGKGYDVYVGRDPSADVTLLIDQNIDQNNVV